MMPMELMLDMLKGIQALRTPFFDQLFVGITVLGEEYFAIAIFCKSISKEALGVSLPIDFLRYCLSEFG